MKADLDLFLPTEDYNSPLPLSVGRSFYRKRGNLYLKNSGTQRKSHEQTKVNQLLQYRRSNVAGVLQENKKTVQGCCDTFKENLRKFREIKDTGQVVRNDMTNAEQRRLSLRIANRRKLKEILHVLKGSGRTLLEYAFMEADIRER